MKKILGFLRSMRFGMTLLVLILICSAAGSLIPQGEEAAYYLLEYPSWGGLLLALRVDRLFSAWYFVGLVLLLCVNLTFCSVLRLGATGKAARALPLAAAQAELRPAPVPGEDLAAFVRSRRFRPVETAAGRVWAKNRLGHYGSFAVHLALLLLLTSGAAVLGLSASEDVTVHVGETVALADGTELHLIGFRAEDETGAADYVSTVALRSAAGTVAEGEIRVNYPLSAAGRKLYQFDYGLDGQLTVTYGEQSETLCMTPADEESFFSVDGENGLTYYGLFPDYKQDEDGRAVLITDTSGGYPNPVYAVRLMDGGEETVGLVPPGETLSAGGVLFAFGQPVEYSVLRVKTYPAAALALLYGSFALLTAGLWLCFFTVPVYVKLGPGGYAVRSPKPDTAFEERLRLLKTERTVGRHA